VVGFVEAAEVFILKIGFWLVTLLERLYWNLKADRTVRVLNVITFPPSRGFLLFA
jgi:hypothetical protein